MKKRNRIITRTSGELAAALGLSPADAVEFETRSALTEQIIRIVRKSAMTHARVAKAAGMSRTRLTAILNRNTQGVSTDLLLRILAALGYRAKISVLPARPAA